MKNVATQSAVSTLFNARQVLAASALVLGVMASGHALAFEADLASLPAPAAGQRVLTRAEVIADLNLWRRAGADRQAELATHYQVSTPAHEQALAEYSRLRSGPAFAAEVAKVLGREQASVRVDAR